MESGGSVVVVENEEELSKRLADTSEGIKGSRSAIKSVEANIKRGLAALNKALLDKTSVSRAMYRSGMGWVDFVWGDEGGKINPKNGSRRGAKGLSHIIDARQRKDGLTKAQVNDLLLKIVETIAKGEETRRTHLGRSVLVEIQRDNVVAFLTKNPGSNSWLLTGFYLRDSGDKQVGYDSLSSTHRAPHYPDARQGADSLSPRTENQRHALATDTVGLGEGPSIETNSSVAPDRVSVKKSEDGAIQPKDRILA